MSSTIGVWHDMVPDPEHAMRMFTRRDPKEDYREKRRLEVQATDGLITEPSKRVATDGEIRYFFMHIAC